MTAAILAVFGLICSHGFVSFDDYLHLHDNPHLNPPSLPALWSLWRAPYRSEYVPLSYTLFAGTAWLAQLPPEDYGGSRLDPAVFHAVGLLLHWAATIAVFVLLRSVWRQTFAACAGALVFAIHPLQVESVAWISETRGLLAGFLSVLAISQYLLFASPTGTGSRRIRWAHYCAATALFSLALLAKSAAAAAPLIALLLDVGLLERNWRTAVRCLAPWMAFSAAMAVLMKVQQTDGRLDFVAPLWTRPLIAADALVFYLKKLALPVNLAIHYDRAPGTVVSSPWLYVGVVILVAIAAVLYRARRLRFLWLSAALFVAGVAPVLGLVPFLFQNYSTVADRYVYLAMLGPALGVSGLLAHAGSRRLAVACLAILVVWGGMSYVQATHWRDSQALYRRALDVNPRSYLAHNNLATDFIQAGDYTAALRHADQALESKPHALDARILRALALSGEGRTAEAMGTYEQVLEESPENTLARLNLAVLEYRQGHVEQAIEHYRRILKTSPENAVAHRKLGGVLAVEGQLDEAIQHLNRAVQFTPRNAAAHAELATALAIDDQPHQAIEHYRAALDLSPPDWHLVANRLAHLLATHPDPDVRDGQDALRLAQAACRQSDYAAPELLQTLAASYAELGRIEEARRVTNQALALARQQVKPTLVVELERNLASYRDSKPWRIHPRQVQATSKDKE